MTIRAETTPAKNTGAFALRPERATDMTAREALLDLCFGADRDGRTCQRLREGRLPAEGLAFSATQRRRLVGTLRLWNVAVGGKPVLLLGPIAVDPALQSRGIGAALMRQAIGKARQLGHAAIVLLGDAPYYARFGFSAVKAKDLRLPGPFERERLLGLELRDGALEGAWGMIVATGATASEARGHRTGRSRRLTPQAA
jgi:predicted N-acetyltransferase YhbS